MQKRCRRTKRLPAPYLFSAVLLIVAVGELPPGVHAQTDPLRIHQTESEAIAIYQKTQQAEDRWAEQKTAMQARYHALQAEEKSLENRHDDLMAQVSALQNSRAEAERTIAERARVGEELQTHLETLMARLEDQIARDLPFLPGERAQRVEDVKKVLGQPDMSLAEKSRRVMEAIKIETEYGRTVEVYQESIRQVGRGEDQPIMADILRVGRLALFWRTPDGKTVGEWNRVAGEWTLLPKKYGRSINDAMEMALKQRTIDMVRLPLGRIAHP